MYLLSDVSFSSLFAISPPSKFFFLCFSFLVFILCLAECASKRSRDVVRRWVMYCCWDRLYDGDMRGSLFGIAVSEYWNVCLLLISIPSCLFIVGKVGYGPLIWEY